MCDQICVIEVPKISGQESVEAFKTFPSRPNFRKDVWTGRGFWSEQIGFVEVPKISSQESVKAV